MKTKQQKRTEAIERLERRPTDQRDADEARIQEVWGRRLKEAGRLREKFGMQR
jgi:hypothetical protein